MSTTSQVCETLESAPFIECGKCTRKLPLRMTSSNHNAAVWECAKCNLPYIATFVVDSLGDYASWVKLDERYFDISLAPGIPLEQRREVSRVATRRAASFILEKRRSQRIPRSLVLPAIEMDDSLCPIGKPFPIMAANLSREGVGLVHTSRLNHRLIALEFTSSADEKIQVVTQVVRQEDIGTQFVEIGGEFVARLGSVAGS